MAGSSSSQDHAPTAGSALDGHFDGYVEEVDGDTVYLRLLRDDGDWQMTLPMSAFKIPAEPHEIREGVIFFLDVAEDGSLRFGLPPRYTAEDIRQAEGAVARWTAFLSHGALERQDEASQPSGMNPARTTRP